MEAITDKIFTVIIEINESHNQIVKHSSTIRRIEGAGYKLFYLKVGEKFLLIRGRIIKGDNESVHIQGNENHHLITLITQGY